METAGQMHPNVHSRPILLNTINKVLTHVAINFPEVVPEACENVLKFFINKIDIKGCHISPPFHNL